MGTNVNDYSIVLSQVYEILQYLPKEHFEKIPKKMLDEITKNKNMTYKYEYDIDKGLDDTEILEETKDLMSAIYVSYLCDEKRKAEIIEICKENDKRIQEELEKKYSVDNLFKKVEKETKTEENKIENNTTTETTTDLIEQQEDKWYTKIFNKVKEFFSSLKK